MDDERLIETSIVSEDIDETSLRPKKFSEYIGQSKAKENLIVFIEAARQRK